MPYYTYDGSGNRTVEQVGDIRDMVYNIDISKSPFLSTLPRRTVGDNNPKIVEDSLASASSSNAHAEDAAAPASSDTTRSLVTNWCQLYMTTGDVSDTQNAINQYGISTEFSYQQAKKLIEFRRDIETILVGDQTAQAPTSANSRIAKSAGISTFIATSTSGTFSEANLDSMLIDVVAAGGEPDVIWVTAAMKYALEAYTTNFTVNVDATAATRGDTVDFYKGTLTGGPISVKWHYLLPSDIAATAAEVIIMQTSLWEICELIPIYWKVLPDTGAGPAGAWRAQNAILCHAEQGNGQFTA